MEEGKQVVTTAGMNGYRSVAYKYLYYPDGRVEKFNYLQIHMQQ